MKANILIPMERSVYVIGHKNPDTDSVVSAAAYAELKRKLGMKEARAARAGAVNPQTEYIFERFKVPLPEFLPDLIPKVEYWLGDPVPTVKETIPLWEALSLMGKAENRVLPIVDEDGRYKALLHYGAFAQNILTKINPHTKAIITTSVGHLIATAKAQPLLVFDEAA
ncbi:MAG: CBS domain-containing protein, partial [Rectinemataceae bacterium]